MSWLRVKRRMICFVCVCVCVCVWLHRKPIATTTTNNKKTVVNEEEGRKEAEPILRSATICTYTYIYLYIICMLQKEEEGKNNDETLSFFCCKHNAAE